MLTASQLSRSGRAIRRYFFFFFGFFFSFRMFWPLAMGSPPLVGLFGDYNYRCPGRPADEKEDEEKGRSGGGLRHGRSVAAERGATHVARLVRREGPGTVHGLTVVPHHQITHPPLVGIDELALGGVLDQVAQEKARLRHRPADDTPRVRGQVERLAPRPGVNAHEALAHRLEARALLVGEVGKAELLPRED